MKDIRVTFTWHLSANRPDEAPSLRHLTIPVDDHLVSELQSTQGFPPIRATPTDIKLRCINEMILWYSVLNCMYILADDKILSIMPA